MTIKKELYESLTVDDKIGLLYYIRGQQGLVQVDHYGCTTVNPCPTPKPDNLYISNVLGFDFDMFYNKESFNAKKYTQEFLDKAMKLGSGVSPFIGDAIKDILYLKLDIIDDCKRINESLMLEIDEKIKEVYNTYESIGAEYVKVDVSYNGEKLYRRVK